MAKYYYRGMEGEEGGARHLTEIYAINVVKEVIKEAKLSLQQKWGKFTIPHELMDELLIECEEIILKKGTHDAEMHAKKRIDEYLELKRKFKREEDERKVLQRLPKE